MNAENPNKPLKASRLRKKDWLVKYQWLVLLIFALYLALICSLSFAQDNTSAEKQALKNAYEDDANIESVERVIAVSKLTGDESIRKRLLSILESSGKYQDLSVKVEDGLVFIDASASNTKYVEWAGEIAKNVEGVVAVINNVETASVDYFSFAPIKGELIKLYFKGLELLPMIVIGFFIFFLFFFLSRPLSSWFTRPIAYLTDSELIRIVLKRIIALFIILVGFYFFLKIAGLTQFAFAVISGTGVMGLVLGFAFRDIAENFISSLLISVQRPFHLNDVIEVNGFKGVVRKVTARGTTLVDFDGNHIQIPNAVIYKNVIQNFSANPNTRGNFVIGIGYDSSIMKAQEIAMKIMFDHQAVLKDPEPQVLVDALASSTVNLKIYFWVDSHTYSVVKVASLLMRQIMREFERSGMSMPDDAREIIFPHGIPGIGENASAPAGDEDVKQLPNTKATQAPGSPSVIELDQNDDATSITDDLSSDTDDIREQAERARDPEGGKSII